jgi:cyclopropane-fatty-acyl-phospholipid synthase
MNERSLTLPMSGPLASPVRGLARKLVLAGLSRMTEGHITLELPDGTVTEVGDRASKERARAQILDDEFFLRLVMQGELGAGEAYQDGLWRSDDLVGVLRLFLRNLSNMDLDSPLARLGQAASLVGHFARRNSRKGSAKNIQAHYDLSNAMYQLFLDRTMAYSCAVYPDEASLASGSLAPVTPHAGAAVAGTPEPRCSLEEAQRRKYELICDKLALGASDHVLEIGSGWGGFAIHAASTRGCRVHTITVSRAQAELARERVAAAGLGERVHVELRDYRDVAGRYDKIVSIEMFEAIGAEYFGTYFAKCSEVLAPGGTMLLQTIAMPEQRFSRYRRNVDWHQKYIFPGAVIPSLGAMLAATGAASDLTVHHVEDIGRHYAPTLREWKRRFFEQLDQVRRLGFDDRFVRTWDMYLSFSEAAFAERTLVDYQILLTRPNNRALGYPAS